MKTVTIETMTDDRGLTRGTFGQGWQLANTQSAVTRELSLGLVPGTRYAIQLIPLPEGYRLATDEDKEKPKTVSVLRLTEEGTWHSCTANSEWYPGTIYAVPMAVAVQVDGKSFEIPYDKARDLGLVGTAAEEQKGDNGPVSSDIDREIDWLAAESKDVIKHAETPEPESVLANTSGGGHILALMADGDLWAYVPEDCATVIYDTNGTDVVRLPWKASLREAEAGARGFTAGFRAGQTAGDEYCPECGQIGCDHGR